MDKNSRWIPQRGRLEGVESRQMHDKKGTALSIAYSHFRFSNYVNVLPIQIFFK